MIRWAWVVFVFLGLAELDLRGESSMNEELDQRLVVAYMYDEGWPQGLGFGNQLMTYALAYSFAKETALGPISVYHGLNRGDKSYEDSSRRDYALNDFGINATVLEVEPGGDEFCAKGDICEINSISEYEECLKEARQCSCLFMHLIFEKNVTEYVERYKSDFQKIFEYQKDLSEQARSLLEWIRGSESVGIHIRLGDAVDYGWSASLDYHIRAAFYIFRENPRVQLFLFSDDCESLSQYLKNKVNIYEVLLKEGATFEEIRAFELKLDTSVLVSSVVKHSLEEFVLMSQCKFNIISKSTFSWWAAFLNKNEQKIVIEPENSGHKKFDENFPRAPRGDNWIEM